jgi:hypothetical protein
MFRLPFLFVVILLLSLSNQAWSQKASTKTTNTLDPKTLAELSREHSRSLDALMATESRLSTLLEKLYSSRLVVRYTGQIDRPFSMIKMEMDIDGHLAYRQTFSNASSAANLKLFDGYLPPGRHVLAVRIYARGPDDPADGIPGYFAGSGLSVHLRENSVCNAVFEAEQDGDSAGKKVAREKEPSGEWEIEIDASFETSPIQDD